MEVASWKLSPLIVCSSSRYPLQGWEIHNEDMSGTSHGFTLQNSNSPFCLSPSFTSPAVSELKSLLQKGCAISHHGEFAPSTLTRSPFLQDMSFLINYPSLPILSLHHLPSQAVALLITSSSIPTLSQTPLTNILF